MPGLVQRVPSVPLFVIHPLADEADDDGEQKKTAADAQNSGIQIHEWLLVIFYDGQWSETPRARDAGVKRLPPAGGQRKADALQGFAGCSEQVEERRSLGEREHAADVAGMGQARRARGRKGANLERGRNDPKTRAGGNAVCGVGARGGGAALALLATVLAQGRGHDSGRGKGRAHHGGCNVVAAEARQWRRAAAGQQQHQGGGYADAAAEPESPCRPHVSDPCFVAVPVPSPITNEATGPLRPCQWAPAADGGVKSGHAYRSC